MKKNILLFACIIFTIHANAQSVRYGLAIGANFTNMDGKGIKNSYYPGGIAGGFARVVLNRKWDIEPEILFNYVNTKKADNFLELYNIDGYANSNESIKLSYASVPVLVGYKINNLVTINAGPQYNFLADDNENLIQNNKKAFKRNDLAVTAGAELDLSGVRFFADYVLGVTNINDIDTRYKWYNRQVFAGLNFNIF